MFTPGCWSELSQQRADIIKCPGNKREYEGINVPGYIELKFSSVMKVFKGVLNKSASIPKRLVRKGMF